MIDGPIPEGLTFDDVLLLPGKSSVPPAEADTRTCLSRKIALNIPIVAAAMDTVTDARLAIAIARQGGIGFVHRNMSIDRQAEEVDRVKRSESGMIVDPVTIALAAAAFGLIAAARAALAAYVREPLWTAMTQPVMAAVWFGILVRSIFHRLVRRKLTWRGRSFDARKVGF